MAASLRSCTGWHLWLDTSFGSSRKTGLHFRGRTLSHLCRRMLLARLSEMQTDAQFQHRLLERKDSQEPKKGPSHDCPSEKRRMDGAALLGAQAYQYGNDHRPEFLRLSIRHAASSKRIGASQCITMSSNIETISAPPRETNTGPNQFTNISPFPLNHLQIYPTSPETSAW